MSDNIIKDTRVFPEEMHESYQKTKKESKDNPLGVLWWIIGLLVLLAIVFYVGLWAGKRTQEQVQNQNTQEQVNTVVAEQHSYQLYADENARTQRLRNFFGE